MYIFIYLLYINIYLYIYYIIYIHLDVPEGLVFFPLSPNLPFYLRGVFDFWSVLPLEMSFSRFDASFLLMFEDVSGARLNN